MKCLETRLSKKDRRLIVVIAVILYPAIVNIKNPSSSLALWNAAQICATCLTQLEEPPQGRIDAQVALILSRRIGVELVYEGSECGNVAP